MILVYINLILINLIYKSFISFISTICIIICDVLDSTFIVVMINIVNIMNYAPLGVLSLSDFNQSIPEANTKNKGNNKFKSDPDLIKFNQ